MNYFLFIDDERNPEDVTWAPQRVKDLYNNRSWVVCRNHCDVMKTVSSLGMPTFVSFDHDLGEVSKDGYWIAKKLVDTELSGLFSFPGEFDYYVHSKNPIGKANIEMYLNGYMTTKLTVT